MCTRVQSAQMHITINLRGKMLEYIKFKKRNFVSIPNNIAEILHNISCNVYFNSFVKIF